MGAHFCTSRACPEWHEWHYTFMGNPLAGAVANESLVLLNEGNWKADITRIGSTLKKELSPASACNGVAEVRVLGAIGVIQIQQPIDTLRAQAFFVERGVWVRPFGTLLYVMPPYSIDDSDLATVCRTMVKFAGVSA